jgi:hypothetical protein
MCGEVNFLVWRWHGEVCVPQARAIWPESQAWLGYGMAITLGPSLRSSISVTLFASIQGVGASPYKKSRATFAGHVLEKQYGSLPLLVVRHGETEKPTKNLQGRGIKWHPPKSPQ